MSLATLIRGKKPKSVLNFATATVATIATVPARAGILEPSVAKVACVAVAEPKSDVYICRWYAEKAEKAHLTSPKHSGCWSQQKENIEAAEEFCNTERLLAARAINEKTHAELLPGLVTNDIPDFDEVTVSGDRNCIHIPAMSPANRVCRCCNGTDFWDSAVQENISVCRKCHPPAPGAERISPKQPDIPAEG